MNTPPRPAPDTLLVSGAVILAGGEGRRMGRRDKSRLVVAGRELGHHVGAKLAPQARLLALAAPETRTPLMPPGFARINDMTDDADRPIGPLGGLAAAGLWAKAGLDANDWVISAPVDCPLFPADFGARCIAAASGETEIVVAAFKDRTYPVCALWRVGALAAISGYLKSGTGDYSVRTFMLTRNTIHIDFSPWHAQNPFAGANTTAELGVLAGRMDG
ncbi:MAG: NTP transferase domain-containing protein [Alphaproteobacteria bacterium]|nr:NTP transferase domain-containing protein [Alphaproteobacteria bacterium]